MGRAVGGEPVRPGFHLFGLDQDSSELTRVPGGGLMRPRPQLAARAIAAMSAGRTRQHPPTMFAPAAIHCRGCAAA